jgi:23S rRNA (pseudouridine1915-N3)-methyltransferase
MIQLLAVTKKPDTAFLPAIELYEKRLKHYITYKTTEIQPSNLKDIAAIKQEEGNRILQAIKPEDFLILLDNKGIMQTTEEFASFLQRCLNDSSHKTLFCLGGAYGFSADVYARAKMKLSLSAMTLPHQLCRLLFTEQLYRACTILRGEKYHHS